MPLARFEPAIPASEQLQIHALDRAATGFGNISTCILLPTTHNKSIFGCKRPLGPSVYRPISATEPTDRLLLAFIMSFTSSNSEMADVRN